MEIQSTDQTSSNQSVINELAQLQPNEEISSTPNKRASEVDENSVHKPNSSVENLDKNTSNTKLTKPTTITQVTQVTQHSHTSIIDADVDQSQDEDDIGNTMCCDLQLEIDVKNRPIDRVKEAGLTHVKWTINWRIIFTCCILGLLWWMIGLIYAIKDHKKIPFCDVNEPLFYSCNGLSERHAANLCHAYCTNEPCWKKLDDTENDITYITSNGYIIGSIVNGSCADYNNESTAMFYCRIFFLIIILFWCWKVFKQIWKGIELPSLETQKVTGCKKILKIPDRIGDKFYDLRINIRFLAEKVYRRYADMPDTDDEQRFIHIMLNGFLLLFTMRFFLLDLPLIILNLCSKSILLKVTGGMELFLDLMYCYHLIRKWKKALKGEMFDPKTREKMKEKYPERNIKFVEFYEFVTKFWSFGAMSVTLPPLMMAYFALPVSNYDSWLRAITIFKNVYRLLGLSRGFRLSIIASMSLCSKISVSKRESLLIKDILKLFFVWTIFKIGIKDDDPFIVVDVERATPETIVFDDRKPDSNYNTAEKIIFPWTVLSTVAVFWGFGCYFSLGNGKYELDVFQDFRF